MPIHKFRSVNDMPRPTEHAGIALSERIRTLWNRAFLLSPPSFGRGVTRFTSIEAANDARTAETTERMRRAANLDP
jgi:hypothetical protein